MITRYKFNCAINPFIDFPLEESEEGGFVKYDDHLKKIGEYLSGFGKRFEEKERENTLLLNTLKLVYQKHCLGSDAIGWSELNIKLVSTLCEVMGDEGFQEWLHWKER